MAHFSALSLVTEALERRLTAALAQSGLVGVPARRHMLQPAPTASQPMLTVFLYDIAEDSTVRNAAPMTVRGPDSSASKTVVKRAPIPLILRYLLTPWSTNPADAQLMLGCTIAALHDARTLIGHDVRALFAGNAVAEQRLRDIDVLSITMAQLTLEEKSKIWWAIQQPYHLSVIYELRVLEIDAFTTSAIPGAPIKQRDIDARLPIGGLN